MKREKPMDNLKEKDIPAATYDDMQKIYEKFLQRKAARVEGNWFLFEKKGEEARIAQAVNGFVAGSFLTMEEQGWTVTPLIIFRRGEVVDDQS